MGFQRRQLLLQRLGLRPPLLRALPRLFQLGIRNRVLAIARQHDGIAAVALCRASLVRLRLGFGITLGLTLGGRIGVFASASRVFRCSVGRLAAFLHAVRQRAGLALLQCRKHLSRVFRCLRRVAASHHFLLIHRFCSRPISPEPQREKPGALTPALLARAPWSAPVADSQVRGRKCKTQRRERRM